MDRLTDHFLFLYTMMQTGRLCSFECVSGWVCWGLCSETIYESGHYHLLVYVFNLQNSGESCVCVFIVHFLPAFCDQCSRVQNSSEFQSSEFFLPFIFPGLHALSSPFLYTSSPSLLYNLPLPLLTTVSHSLPARDSNCPSSVRLAGCG